MARDDVWTEKQITIVLYEYCQRPFGQFSGTKPFLKELGTLINRTPGAIVRKVGNLASFDPQMRARDVGGLAHTSKLDKVVWDRYYGHWEQLANADKKLPFNIITDVMDIFKKSQDLGYTPQATLFDEE